MSRRAVAAVAAAALAVVAGGVRGAGAEADPVSGEWSATLEIPAGEVGFGLDLRLAGGSVTGAILNGPERQELSGGSFDGTTLTLRLDYYDGAITARFEGADRATLSGEYARQTRAGIGRFPFRATRRAAGAALASAAASPAALTAEQAASLDISGDWLLTLRTADGKVAEVDEATFERGALEAGALAVTGTIIPVSGDYGLLHGAVRLERDGRARPRFRMGRFDGIHVTLVTGEVRADGTLSGEIALGQSYRVSFTGVRKERASAGARPEDPNAVTTVRAPAERFAFSVPGPDGRPVSLADERFAGKVVVVDVFGTWCPNCHDEAPLLVDLYRKYRAAGLEIVALAYEYTDDAERNARQIEIYRRKYGIEFPILVAGTTAEGEIARTLPQLVGFAAYPTTIFVGRDGRVRKIHAGFSGPATGPRHDEVKREFEETVRSLLEENGTASGSERVDPER